MTANKENQRLSYQQRLEIIYSYHVSKVKIVDISAKLGINYSSIRTVLKAYSEQGRVNKLHTLKSKEAILNMRREEKQLEKAFARSAKA